MKKPKPKRRTHASFFYCLTCGGKSGMSPAAIKSHLVKVHKLSKPKGKRETTLCIDGEDYYRNAYLWTLTNGVTIEQISTGPNEFYR